MNKTNNVYPNPWAFFDKIYCISLEERPDRQQEAKIQFANVGLSDYVQFFIVKKHSTNCEQGIFESHLACIQQALTEQATTILIFEDDIFFEGYSQKKIQDCTWFLSNISKWSMFFLGCLVNKSTKTTYPSILKMNYTSLTHAYAIHRNFAQILVNTSWQNIPYDGVLKSMQDDHCYGIYPSFAFQSRSSTDNINHMYLNFIRNLLGGLKQIQKMNEFYYQNKSMIILFHLIGMIMITVCMVFFIY
ncbi:MAG: glycosyltransferase family 25 protein [Desulfobacterales bacterium]|nr:glycosyltransferase family 25 protein [Desulfobacterales bacterium]